MKVKTFLISIALIVLVISCKKGTQETQTIDLTDIDLSEKGRHLNELDTLGAGIPIFYNMYLSVELSTLFETAGAIFTPALLNQPDKVTEYATSYKKAMNLGVYAVDLSYARVFEQYETAGKYFSAMQSMAEQLGIPQNYFEETARRFERNLTNKDSLISIANEVYYQTEEYLKENERYSTASLIIVGGWVEAIYIASHVVLESKNPDVIERLVDQKYSLNNLLIMLKDYTDNQVVSEYIAKLTKLQTIYNGLQIEIPAGYVPNSAAGKASLEKWLSEVKKLQAEVQKIRKSIIE